MSILLFMGGESLHAQNYTWTGAGPDQNWTDGTNWATGVFPSSNPGNVLNSGSTTNQAVFAGSGTGTVYVNAPIALGGIQFAGGSYTLTGYQLLLYGQIQILSGFTGVDTIASNIVGGPISSTGNITLDNNGNNGSAVLDITGSISNGQQTGSLTLEGSATSFNTVSGLVFNATDANVSNGATPFGGALFRLVKTGTGWWDVTNNENIFSGYVQDNQGLLGIGSIGNIGAASSLGTGLQQATIYLGGSSTLQFLGTTNQASNRPIIFGDSASANVTETLQNSVAGTTVTLTGGIDTITSNTNLLTNNTVLVLGGNVPTSTGTFTAPGNFVLSGGINGSGTTLVGDFSITNDTTGTSLISGISNYTNGLTVTTTGTLEFGNETALYDDDTASWTGTNIQVANGGTLALQVGPTGSGYFTTNDIATLLGMTSTASKGWESGSFIGLDTTYASGPITFSSNIVNPGGDTLGLTKLGPGTLVLSGTNSFTGGVNINGGVIQAGSAGSLSTTGNIDFKGGTLQYTSASATNDYSGRIASGTSPSAVSIDINGQNVTFASALTTNQSGGFTLIDSGTNSTLTLSGANAYTGPTTINGGTLQVAGSGTLGNTSNALIVNGGSLDLDGTSQTVGNFTGIPSGTILDSTGTVSTLTIGSGNGTGGNFAGVIENGSGFVALAKTGTGTLALSGSNTYTGGTSVNAGTLIAENATALGGSANNVTVASGAALDYAASTNAQLAIGGELGVTGGTGTTIGGSIGSTATSAEINVMSLAASSGNVTVNIYGISGVSPLAGTNTYTLVAGGGGSSLTSTNTLGFVYNNSNFTVGGLSETSNALQVAISSATPLTSAYWQGGLTGAVNVWAASNGSSKSNWTSTNGGSAQALTPGGGTTVYISNSAITTAPTSTVLGANMSIAGLVIQNTVTGLGLNADGNTLTITGANGITDNTNVAASFIAANVALGTNQTWTNNSVNALTVSGAVSGAGNLTTTGTGTVILSGANNYSGSTTVAGGALNVQSNSALAGTSGVTVATGGTLQLQGGVSANPSLTLNGGGLAATQNGALESVSGNNTYSGLITLGANASIGSDAGTLNLTNTNVLYGTSTGFGLTLTGAGNGIFAGIFDGGTSGAAGAGTLTKSGLGTWTLTGANTYTGATIVNGGTLQVGNGAVEGTLASTALTLGGGTFIDNYTGGQTISFSTGGTTINPGLSGVTAAAGDTINLGTITTTNGSAVNFSSTGTIDTSNTTNVNGIMGGNATYGGTTWAVAPGSVGGAITGLASSSYYETSNGGATAGNYATNTNVDVNLTETIGAAVTLNSIRYNTIPSGNGLSLTLTGANTLTSGGILITTNAGDYSVAGANFFLSGATGATLTSGGSNIPITVFQNAVNYTFDIGVVLSGSNGLTIAGPGVTQLLAVDTYTGPTLVADGTLEIGNGTSANDAIANSSAITVEPGANLVFDESGGNQSNSITNNGTVSGYANLNESFTLSGNISGAGGALVQLGPGTFVLSGTNSYTGATTIDNGALQIKSNGALGSAGGQSSGVTVIGGNAALQLANNITTSAAVPLTLNGNGVTTVPLTNSNFSPNTTVETVPGNGALENVSGTNTYTGLVTLGSTSSIGSDAGLLILSNTGNITGAYGLTLIGAGNGTIDSGIATGANSLTLNGTGTWILAGASAFTGGVNINSGILKIGNGTTGSIAGANALTLGGGTFYLQGTGNSVVNQTVASLATTAGSSSTITINPNFTGSDTTTLTITSTNTSIGLGSVLSFNYSLGTTVGTNVGNDYVIWDPTLSNGIIGSGYTVTDTGGTGLATVITSGTNDVVVRLLDNGTSGLPVSGGISTSNYFINQNYSTTSTSTAGSLVEALSGNDAANSVTVNTTTNASFTGFNLALGTHSLAITNNGTLLFTGTNTYTITATNPGGVGGLTGDGTADGTLFIVNDISGTNLNIEAPIIDNGADLNVTFSGTGTTILTETNTDDGQGNAETYAGATTVTTGTLIVGNGTTGSIDESSSVTLSQGATVTFNAYNGDNYAGNMVNTSGTITGSEISGNSNTLSGNISGSGAFTQNGAGTTILSGSNSYTGATTVSAGTLNLTGSLFDSSVTVTGTGVVVESNTGSINGPGVATFTQASTGTSILAGTNNYGPTTIDAGTLSLSGTLIGSTITTATNGIFSETSTGSISGLGYPTNVNYLVQGSTGTSILAGTNLYTGRTAVNAGALEIESAGALGTTNASSSLVTVASGAALQLSGGITTTTAVPLTINGAGVTASPNGALENVSGSNTYTGLVTLGTNATIDSVTNTLTLSNPGTITGATFALTLGGAGNGVIESIIGTTTGGLIKTGAGTWTLTGTNTYTGTTTIQAGTLDLQGGGSLNSSSAVTVSNNGTLGVGSVGGIGTAAGTVAVSAGGTINVNGGGTGVLHTGALTLSGTSGSSSDDLVFSMTNSGATTSLDSISVNGSATFSSSNGTLITINNLSGTPNVGDYNLIVSTAAISDTNVVLSTTSLDGYTLALGISGDDIQLDITAASAPAVAYWTGASNTSWQTYQNFSTTNTTNTPATGVPGTATDVVFSTSSPTATNLSTTLDAPTTVNSLTFNATSGTVTIAAGTNSGSLTLEATTTTSSNGINVAPNGINDQSGAGAVTISAPVALGTNQTWTNASSNALTISGVVSGGYALTTA
ncbi:MAG: autotransporter-associated beta strand repeat-containing protein, partial [Methylacidiphilales bacterium]|nr:autotransporter-associated beta strand repeat-containing protein [Candidatus Methylacidiphilales bacterium]